MSKFQNRFSLLVAIVLLPLAGCSDSDEATSASSVAQSSDSELLNYIPANASYVIASTEPWPEDVIEALEPKLNRVLGSYHNMLTDIAAAAVAEAEEEGKSPEDAAKLEAIFGEFSSLLSLEGLREAGIESNASVVIYGNGILPVMRLELSDGALFEAALGRIEAEAGESMDVMSVDGNSVRYAGDDDMQFMIAILEDQVVFTLTPTAFDDAQRAELLGFTAPANNIVDSGKLDDLASKYGYNYWMIGYADIVDIVNWGIGNGTGLDADLYALVEEADSPSNFDDVCKAEILELAGVMPRIAMGYTELGVERARSEMIIELRSDIASDLMNTTASVPGLGTDPGGAMSYGMSFNVMGWRQFAQNRLDALDADPFECALLADIEQSTGDIRAALNQPMPPFVTGLRGFFIDIEEIVGLDMATQAPPSSIDGRLLVSMENAPAMVQMAAMFSPELATIGLEANGEPVLLDVPQAAMAGGPAYAAMNDDALAISIGEGQQNTLGDMLEGDSAEGNLMLSFSMDAGRYYEFMGEVMMTQDYGDDEDAMPPGFNESMRDLMLAFADIYDRFLFNMEATEDGIVLDTTVWMDE